MTSSIEWVHEMVECFDEDSARRADVARAQSLILRAIYEFRVHCAHDAEAVSMLRYAARMVCRATLKADVCDYSIPHADDLRLHLARAKKAREDGLPTPPPPWSRAPKEE